jgi:putative membrane protein
MTKLNSLVLAMVIGAAPVAFAQNQPAQPNTGDPSSASSPHQRQAVGEDEHGKMAGHDMKTASDKSGADPATFVKKAALGGMTEVETSKLAASKAEDPQVRSFAQKMVTDHTKANDELKSLAKKKGWTLPTSLDAEHKAIVQKLSAKSGADFDAAYSKQMMQDHEKTVALFKGATQSSDADLAQWAEKTLPTLEKHEQLAANLPAESHSASASKTPQRQ